MAFSTLRSAWWIESVAWISTSGKGIVLRGPRRTFGVGGTLPPVRVLVDRSGGPPPMGPKRVVRLFRSYTDGRGAETPRGHPASRRNPGRRAEIRRVSRTDFMTGAWRRLYRMAFRLSPGARMRLALAAGPLACLWAMEASPARFDQAPLASGLLAIIVFACAPEVIAGGLHDLLVSVRPTRDALAAAAAWIGFSASFLFAALHARGRLPEVLQDSSGEPLLFFASSGTIIALRLLSRETLERILPAGLASADAARTTRREIEIGRWASAGLGACAVLALGALVPAAILTGGATAAPACMAAIAGFSPEIVALVLALTRTRAAAFLPDENPERSLEGLEACSKLNGVIF